MGNKHSSIYLVNEQFNLNKKIPVKLGRITVKDIKDQIVSNSITHDIIRISYKGRELSDHWVLSSYGIKHGDVLNLDFVIQQGFAPVPMEQQKYDLLEVNSEQSSTTSTVGFVYLVNTQFNLNREISVNFQRDTIGGLKHMATSFNMTGHVEITISYRGQALDAHRTFASYGIGNGDILNLDFVKQQVPASIPIEQNYYDLLEINRAATHSEINQAYKKKAMEFHPDKNPDRDTTKEFQEIEVARSALLDPQVRQEYDKAIQMKFEEENQRVEASFQVQLQNQQDEATARAEMERKRQQVNNTMNGPQVNRGFSHSMHYPPQVNLGFCQPMQYVPPTSQPMQYAPPMNQSYSIFPQSTFNVPTTTQQYYQPTFSSPQVNLGFSQPMHYGPSMHQPFYQPTFNVHPMHLASSNPFYYVPQ